MSLYDHSPAFMFGGCHLQIIDRVEFVKLNMLACNKFSVVVNFVIYPDHIF